MGILAFASEDGGHFQPSMDTLFLRHLALVLAHLIETLPWQSHDEERRTHPAS
ncbi:3'-5'-cyclic nucleotide phosphodiesterase [Vibrio cholerae]|nr:3'-5'-cyclic nucleotide phosphodiesterase [Vibrio cholerae]